MLVPCEGNQMSSISRHYTAAILRKGKTGVDAPIDRDP